MALAADVKPHALSAEGMILQQKAPAQVWGTADKGETVTVTFRGIGQERTGRYGQLVRNAAGQHGRWSV